jgi:2-(1,2-epoxy-1,2-dihydrophenyl)acetyl-CoA isomerase
MSSFIEPFEYDNFDVTRENDVVNIVMDSTSGMNGLNIGFVDELREIGIALRQDESVRCVTLSGGDDVFSVGADLAQLNGTSEDGIPLRRLASTLHEGIRELMHVRAPLVTVVDGVAAGAGFSMVLLGDIVLVSDEARLEFAYPRIGLTGDGGSTFFLPRLVGLRKAREIVLLDEPIGPEEAVELNLATEVVPTDDLEERRREVAGDLAEGPTHAYSETKRLLLESFERDLDSQLAAETNAMVEATDSGDYRRGYEAFYGDEPPSFEGE